MKNNIQSIELPSFGKTIKDACDYDANISMNWCNKIFVTVLDFLCNTVHIPDTTQTLTLNLTLTLTLTLKPPYLWIYYAIRFFPFHPSLEKLFAIFLEMTLTVMVDDSCPILTSTYAYPVSIFFKIRPRRSQAWAGLRKRANFSPHIREKYGSTDHKY